MPEDFAWLACLVPACAVNVLAQIACYRLRLSGFYASIQLGALAGLVVLLALSFMLGLVQSATSTSNVANLAIYICFAYVFFHFNNMGETARRIRLVTELAAAPDGLSLQDLTDRYNSHEIVDRRLGRLIYAGQIREEDGILRAQSHSVNVIVRVIGLFRLLLFSRGLR